MKIDQKAMDEAIALTVKNHVSRGKVAPREWVTIKDAIFIARMSVRVALKVLEEES